MLMKKKIFVIVISLLLFFPIFTRQVNGQDCGDGYYCQSSLGWGCFGNFCCRCACGNAPGQYGQFECLSDGGCIEDMNSTCTGSGNDSCCRQGCAPCPTSPPSNTATPTPPTATPVTNSYLCIAPGASNPASRCQLTNYTCRTPDVPGGSCFTTMDRCIAGCVIPTGVSITPRPQLNLLTPCAQRGVLNALDTAIGCFPVSDTNSMLTFILRWALGVSGGITFLLVIVSAFLIMSSGGNPEKVKTGRELLTASLAGLILVIFSVFILDLMGIRILRVPGL